MVNYPFSWVLGMTVIAFLLLLPVTYVALKRKGVSVKAIYVSFVPLILSLTTAAAIGYFGWQVLLWLFPQYADIPQNFTYNGYWIIASFISFIVATTLVIYQCFKKHCTSASNYISAIILWLLMNIAIALPGAGFLVMPVFFVLTGLYLLVFYGGDEYNRRLITLLTIILALLI